MIIFKFLRNKYLYLYCAAPEIQAIVVEIIATIIIIMKYYLIHYTIDVIWLTFLA